MKATLARFVSLDLNPANDSVVMAKGKTSSRHPLEDEIENGLRPGDMISFFESSEFVEELERVEEKLSTLAKNGPVTAVGLYETFLAGCYEKAEEFEESDGEFGQFVVGLFCAWIGARQAAGMDAYETAHALLSWIDRDGYGLTDEIEMDVVKAFDKDGLAAFIRGVRERFDAAGNPEYLRRRWGQSLRDIHFARNNLAAYLALAEESGITPKDCLTIASLVKRRGKGEEALAWVERGIAMADKDDHNSATQDLHEMKYHLLAKLGRGDELLEARWGEYYTHPNRFSYEDLMNAVPKGQKKVWHAKAMEVATGSVTGDPGSVIELLLVMKETGRLAEMLTHMADAELEGLSHVYSEPAAEKLARSHPGIAARLWRAQGLRIINARKSKYYDAALGDLERAKGCYAKAGLHEEWEKLVDQVRADHGRKKSFMAAFEDLVAGVKPAEEPSFIEGARARWIPRPGNEGKGGGVGAGPS
jgi:hypothetical protein